MKDNSCILIIDVQKGFINGTTKHIPHLVEKIQYQYSNIFITRFYNRDNSFYRTLIQWDKIEKDTEDFELAFKHSDESIILDKDIYSCINLEFINRLNNNNINEVNICGIDTDICVTKCAVDLFEAGIVPRVLSKYCASSAGYEAHVSGLKTLERFIGVNQVIT